MCPICKVVKPCADNLCPDCGSEFPEEGLRTVQEWTGGEIKMVLEKEEIIVEEKEELEPEMPSKVVIDYERGGIKPSEFSVNKTTCLSESNGIIGPTILP